ncbi:MAG: YceD family protein [Candidatus Zixiibacteriota bacterium]
MLGDIGIFVKKCNKIDWNTVEEITGGNIKPFAIDIKGIPDEGFFIRESFDASHFDLEKADDTSFEGKIEAEVKLKRIGMNYSIDVELHVPIVTRCIKCLVEFSRTETIEFTISGQVNSTGTIYDSFSDAEYEEGFNTGGACRGSHKGFAGTHLDLSPAIRQEIIMNVEDYPTCSEDCLGLCPDCGANLNIGPCECEKED